MGRRGGEMRPELRSAEVAGQPMPNSWDETRRSLLAKAGLIAGGVGLVTLGRSEPALASTITGYINVKDAPYLAQGNGTGDDAAAIQNALNDAANPTLYPPGTAVYIPPGTYPIGSALLMPSKATLRGAGRGSVIVAKSTLSGLAPMITNKNNATTGDNDITIEDLEIDGNRANRTNNTANIHFAANNGGGNPGAQNHRIAVRRVVSHDSKSIGLTFVNSAEVEVSQCTIYNCDRDGCSFFLNCNDIRVEGNHIHDTLDDGIGLNAEDPGKNGHSLQRVAIVGNLIGPGTGANRVINVAGAQQVTIAGNVLFEGETGIIVSNWNNTPARDVVIEGNALYNVGRGNASGFGEGIIVIGALSITSTDGTAGCERILIKGNLIDTPQNNGVTLAASQSGGALTDIVVEGNIIKLDPSQAWTNAGARAISCGGSVDTVRGVTIANNIAESAATQGIIVTGSTYSRASIQNNQVFNSGQKSAAPAIWIDSPSDVLISGNRCTDTQGTKTQTYGLSLIQTVGSTLVTGNDFTGNRDGAIQRVNLNGSTFVFENLGDDAPVARHLSGTTSWDPPSVADGGQSSKTVSVPGASVGDTVAVGFSIAVPAGALLVGAVTSSGTVTVTLFNKTGAALDLGSGTLRADAWKH
jgi:hypothetical protein